MIELNFFPAPKFRQTRIAQKDLDKLVRSLFSLSVVIAVSVDKF